MSALSTSKRLKIALGGFVSFAGFIILIIVFLSATRAANVQAVFQSEVLIGTVALLGFLDLICGFLLVFTEKSKRLLFAPQKKKADNYVDHTYETPDDKTEQTSF